MENICPDEILRLCSRDDMNTHILRMLKGTFFFAWHGPICIACKEIGFENMYIRNGIWNSRGRWGGVGVGGGWKGRSARTSAQSDQVICHSLIWSIFLWEDNEGPNQTAQMSRLTSTFVLRILDKEHSLVTLTNLWPMGTMKSRFFFGISTALSNLNFIIIQKKNK